ncbi:MAG: DNA internalization-related competence protein ComEC/Rec2 [Fuerstiella sp.]|nr:DNA internalization-related competence protein ComEC/Rec2 [Fuerstiella sp.]
MPANIPDTDCSGPDKSTLLLPHLHENQDDSADVFQTPFRRQDQESSRLTRFLRPNLPLSAWTAAALVGGITLGSVVSAAHGLFLAASPGCLIAAYFFRRQHHHKVSVICVLAAFVLFGVVRWQRYVSPSAQRSVSDILRKGPVTLTLSGRIASVPCLHVRPSSKSAPRVFGTAEQSQFLISAQSLSTSSGARDVGGDYHVYVNGNATSMLHKGDKVTLTGRWDWPDAPGNPGEFDYARFLNRRHISGLLFVNHPSAIRVVIPSSKWSAGYWISELRNEAHSVLVMTLPEQVHGIALALLLGNRNQLPSETADAFVASGTMHLLAISGLHVGILCTFLLSIFHLFIIRRSRALLLTAAVCVLYAMITDLRPSVLRATVFFVVFVFAQFVRRNQGIVALLSVTAIIMVSFQPYLVFDTGAWLSFLSVAALGWVSRCCTPDQPHLNVPADALNPVEKLLDVFRALWTRLKLRWRQMLSILALTTPLVAATFHVLSPAGILVNVLLIPLTGLTLCVGFVLLAAGMLHPSLALIAGPGFSWLLAIMTKTVESTASVNLSHVYIADIPDWSLIAYYMLMPMTLLIRWRPLKRIAVCGLYCSVLAGFTAATQPSVLNDLRCTVLDVGHGSAAVLEFPSGEVILVDGGAMNRGERTADVICRFLWNRGYRSLNGILISHADSDHYNAVAGILSRIPVSEIVTSRDFVTSKSASVQSVVQMADATGTPVRILSSGDSARFGRSLLWCLQRERQHLPPDAHDNEKSLIFIAEHAGRRIVLPGDLEGKGSQQVFHDVGPVDVLVSPHHGSPSANTAALAGELRPHTVIVSARDSKNSERLHTVYGEATLYHTSDCGAVSVAFTSDGRFSTTPYRELQRRAPPHHRQHLQVAARVRIAKVCHAGTESAGNAAKRQ